MDRGPMRPDGAIRGRGRIAGYNQFRSRRRQSSIFCPVPSSLFRLDPGRREFLVNPVRPGQTVRGQPTELVESTRDRKTARAISI